MSELAERLLAAYADGGCNDAADHPALPARSAITEVCGLLLRLFFPGFFAPVQRVDLPTVVAADLDRLQALLGQAVAGAEAYSALLVGSPGRSADDLVAAALAELEPVRALLLSDVDAAFANDPAAADRATIILGYPCIEALAVQRFAHRLYRLGIPIVPRMMTEVVHGRTGIDIHPGAAIGPSFFIDHGTGVVIGETSQIGAHCVLYHGVTLGAWNPLVRDDHGDLLRGQSNKRHPDLEDHVTVYPGATILGGDTVIGAHSVIGGNVWLTRSVPARSVVTLKDPETQLAVRQRRS
ncbi:serine acetyltransferase [Planctomycetota bacterium]|nr:serine acetyltransferase [Planctomycetota bacterium]